MVSTYLPRPRNPLLLQHLILILTSTRIIVAATLVIRDLSPLTLRVRSSRDFRFSHGGPIK